MTASYTKPGVLALLLALGACGYTPAQLGITGPSGAAAARNPRAATRMPRR